MLIFICITIISLYLISVPLRVKIKGGVDLEEKKGRLSVSLFHITVFRADGEFKPKSPVEGALVVKNNEKQQGFKTKLNPRSFKEAINTIKNFNYMMFGNLNVSEVYLKINYGQGDALKTTLYLSAARSMFYSLTAVLKSVQKLDVHEEFIPVYNKKTLEVDFHGILSLSIADIIYGFLLSKWNKYLRLIKGKFKTKIPQKA